MSRDRRLTRAFEKARVEYFDDSSKYVFISDCHRGDGSLSDEFMRNENSYLYAMHHYLENGYVYVQVGDGDELWEHRQYGLIKRAHDEVFGTIKRFFDAGRFILLWGNHDNELRNPTFVERNLSTRWDALAHASRDFLIGIRPCEALRMTHRTTGQELFVAHGHQGDLVNDQAWFVAMIALRYFWRYLHAFGARSPASPAMNARKRESMEADYHAWIDRHRTPLICGHTHLFSFPGPDELPYFNAGSCVYPASITALELAGGQMQLVRWRVVASETGMLQVRREVVRGPRSVAEFDMR